MKQLALGLLPSSTWKNIGWRPAKYWLSNLPVTTSLKSLVKLAKHRWVIERDYEELKQELGLGHFEGPELARISHHATLCIAPYGFLMAERNRFSPAARAGHVGLSAPELRRLLPARVAASAPNDMIRTRSPRSTA